MTHPTPMMNIDVCLGTATSPQLVSIELPEGSTLVQAVTASQLLSVEQISAHRFGIFGKIKPLNTVLHNYDRVEIYCPLKIDPKTARAARAKKTRLSDTTQGYRWRQRSQTDK